MSYFQKESMTQDTMKAASDPQSKSAVPEKKKRALAIFFVVAAVLFIAVAVLGVYSPLQNG